MKYTKLGKTGITVSGIAYGGIVSMSVTQDESDRYVAEAFDAGVRYFDVAPSYGDAESRLGPALEPYRSRCALACKTGERSADGAKRELLASLKTLRTDHFDVYQLHAMTTQEDYDAVFSPGGAMETFVWAKREGLIRNIGFSTHSEEIALACLDAFPFDTVLFPFQFSLGINDGWGDRIAARAKKDGFGLLAMKTMIERAWKDGDDRSAWPKSWCKPIDLERDSALVIAAMKRAVSLGANTLVPPGDIAHLRFALEHADEIWGEPLTADELDLLVKRAAAVRENRIFNVK
jgi:aryl-alcohol dehydrogenase-like predicted oxidoreductase